MLSFISEGIFEPRKSSVQKEKCFFFFFETENPSIYSINIYTHEFNSIVLRPRVLLNSYPLNIIINSSL